ncbi:inner nuclear membrane protein enriched at telomere/subtelomere region [Actinomortierella ambigua]|nr:inner nuclear membrane protein enriched at telomere/subtelomere region [Actinomortierella ambigua]
MQPDFDPWTLRMDDIRELLILHKIKPPSGMVRKQALVDLFNKHIRPPVADAVPDATTTDSSTPSSKGKGKDKHVSAAKPSTADASTSSSSKKPSSSKTAAATAPTSESTPTTATLRRSRSRSRTSSSRTPSPTKTTAPSTTAKTVEEQKSRPKATSSKKTVATETEEKEDNDEVPKPKKPPTSRRSKAQQSKQAMDDTESDTPARGRKPKKPSVSDADDTDDSTPAKPRRIPRTNFSKENPFQSASESERSRSRSRDRTRKKKTIRSTHVDNDNGMDGNLTRDGVFKVPPTPQFARFMQVPKRAGQDTTAHGVSTSILPPTSLVPPPGATALNRRRLSGSGATVVPKELDLNRAASSLAVKGDPDAEEWTTTRHSATKGVWLVLLLVYALWYRAARFNIGYCTSLSDPPKNDFISLFRPSCIPCPDHATCLVPDREPECAPEYLLRPNLLSFGNFLPLSPRCVLNKAKEYRSLQVADAAELVLHQHAGRVECDLHRPADHATLQARQRMSLSELKHEIVKKKEDSVTHDEFDMYWNIALRELRGRKDNIVFEPAADEEYIRSLKPRKTLACQVRQALVSWVLKFKMFLSILGLTGVGLWMIYRRIQKRGQERRIVQGLVQNVLIKLADQAYYHYVDPIQYSDTAVSVNQLRDALILNTTFSRERREELWKKVSAIVESNTNVLPGAREFRGDPYQVWEWVGPTGVLSSSTTAAAGAGAVDGQKDAPPHPSDSHQSQHRHHHHHHLPQQQQQQHDYPQAASSGLFGPATASAGFGIDGGGGRRTSRGAGTRADLLYGTGSSVTGYEGVPKQPPQLGTQGSFFGIRRQDSEFLNPGNSLYPTLSQDDYGSFQE